MDNCLGCMACMTACPSGVQYNKLIEPTRAQIERNIPRSPGERLFADCSSPRFRIPRDYVCWRCRCSSIRRAVCSALVRKSGLAQLLPKRLAAMEALLPEVPAGAFKQAALDCSAGRSARGAASAC